MKPQNLTGNVYNRLTVLKQEARHVLPSGWPKAKYFVRCECGKEFSIFATSLTSGKAQSCGCLSKELLSERFKTHGLSKTQIRGVWSAMLERCRNKRHKQYMNYGGRGITVCERWYDLANFVADMGERPKGLTLDRVDNNKGYSHENCRWATKLEQARNTRGNRLFTINGVTKCLSAWCGEYKIHKCTVRGRLTAGWPIELALTNKNFLRRTRIL